VLPQFFLNADLAKVKFKIYGLTRFPHPKLSDNGTGHGFASP